MQAKGFKGSVAGIPVKGGVVSIESADATTILNASSGLVRTIGSGLKTGAKYGLVAAFLSLLLFNLSTKKSPRMSILSLARIKTPKKKFLGICKDEVFECVCEGNELKIPTHTINSISMHLVRYSKYGTPYLEGYNVNLVDGSEYSDCIPITKQLSLLTVCGEQRTSFFTGTNPVIKGGFIFGLGSKVKYLAKEPDELTINGATAEDVDDLRERLQFAFENNIKQVMETVGEDVFKKYFILR